MKRLFAPALLAVLIAAPAHAQLDAPVWYVSYDVIMKVDHTENAEQSGGTRKVTTRLDYTFSASAALDMRNQGQVISMIDMATMDPEKMKNMTPAEQLAFSQQMLDAMNYCANWMPGPDQLATSQEAMNAVAVPVQMNYVRTVTQNNVQDEMGNRFDSVEQITASATGAKLYLGHEQKFEMNTSTKKYWLIVPLQGNDLSVNRNEVAWITVTKTRDAGTTAWGPEEKNTTETALSGIGTIKINVVRQGWQAPVIEGALGAAPTIAGETTFQGQLGDPQGVPLTATVKYRLSQTPPAPKR